MGRIQPESHELTRLMPDRFTQLFILAYLKDDQMAEEESVVASYSPAQSTDSIQLRSAGRQPLTCDTRVPRQLSAFPDGKHSALPDLNFSSPYLDRASYFEFSKQFMDPSGVRLISVDDVPVQVSPPSQLPAPPTSVWLIASPPTLHSIRAETNHFSRDYRPPSPPYPPSRIFPDHKIPEIDPNDPVEKAFAQAIKIHMGDLLKQCIARYGVIPSVGVSAGIYQRIRKAGSRQHRNVDSLRHAIGAALDQALGHVDAAAETASLRAESTIPDRALPDMRLSDHIPPTSPVYDGKHGTFPPSHPPRREGKYDTLPMTSLPIPQFPEQPLHSSVFTPRTYPRHKEGKHTLAPDGIEEQHSGDILALEGCPRGTHIVNGVLQFNWPERRPGMSVSAPDTPFSIDIPACYDDPIGPEPPEIPPPPRTHISHYDSHWGFVRETVVVRTTDRPSEDLRSDNLAAAELKHESLMTSQATYSSGFNAGPLTVLIMFIIVMAAGWYRTLPIVFAMACFAFVWQGPWVRYRSHVVMVNYEVFAQAVAWINIMPIYDEETVFRRVVLHISTNGSVPTDRYSMSALQNNTLDLALFYARVVRWRSSFAMGKIYLPAGVESEFGLNDPALPIGELSADMPDGYITTGDWLSGLLDTVIGLVRFRFPLLIPPNPLRYARRSRFCMAVGVLLLCLWVAMSLAYVTHTQTWGTRRLLSLDLSNESGDYHLQGESWATTSVQEFIAQLEKECYIKVTPGTDAAWEVVPLEDLISTRSVSAVESMQGVVCVPGIKDSVEFIREVGWNVDVLFDSIDLYWVRDKTCAVPPVYHPEQLAQRLSTETYSKFTAARDVLMKLRGLQVKGTLVFPEVVYRSRFTERMAAEFTYKRMLLNSVSAISPGSMTLKNFLSITGLTERTITKPASCNCGLLRRS